ncbi:MAG: hypothetical protein AAFR61_05580 [Bacteroidota bacterium]
MRQTLKPIFLSLCLILFAFTGIKAQAGMELNPNAEQDIEFVVEFIQAAIAADEEKIRGACHDEAMGYGPTVKDSADLSTFIKVRQQAVKNLPGGEFKSGPAMSVIVAEGGMAGTWVFNWGVVETPMKDGDPAEMMVHVVTRLIEGKVERWFAYFDNAYMMERLGYKFTPPGE